MAMVKTDSSISEIEGKEGGTIFRHDVCGQHAQGYPRIVQKEPTFEQMRVRNCFHNVRNAFIKYAAAWFWIPGETEKWYELWTVYATWHPKTNKKGETYHLDAYHSYVSVNMQRCLVGLPITLVPIWTPPEP